jgi:hypothetical protein
LTKGNTAKKIELTEATTRHKYVNKTSKQSPSQPNLKVNSVSPHPTRKPTRPSPGKISQKKKLKIVVVGDSFAKGIAGKLVNNLESAFEVIGHVKPESGMEVM